jgi:arylsulfatase A-like enzyme
MNRRNFLKLLEMSVASCVIPLSIFSDMNKKPNIVFIMADDLGYGDLGCYGQKKIQTPNIDLLAREGIKFKQAYAGSPVCAPSRCSLMTGFHNGHNRIRDNIPHGIFLQPDDFTVAELLKQAGYITGAIGKWSLGNPGSWGVANWQGFDEFFGHLNQDQAHFYYPDYLWENNQIKLLTGNRAEQKEEYSHDLFSEKGLSFIEKHQQYPFFLYLAYTIPHFSDYPNNVPEHFLVPDDAPYSSKDWPQIEKNYAAMITRLDKDVGRIMEKVKSLGLEENTLIIFTSDNGPYEGESIHNVEFFNSNGPLRGQKREVYEGGIRVPFIARWKEVVPENRESDQIIAFWDVLPTLAELIGIEPPKQIDGISFLPTLMGRKQIRQHPCLYWDYGHVRDQYKQAIRYENWKGVRNGIGSPLELYDLEVDIGEKNNLAQKYPQRVEFLEELLNHAYVESKNYPIQTKVK